MKMAQALFDALNGVGVDSQTAVALHFLLGSQPGSITALANNVGLTEDEEDLFQCGKCKQQFSSFAEFCSHKTSHNNSVKLPNNSSKRDETTSLMYPEIVPEQEFTQPITLSDTEFLSLSMDQGPLNIAASQVLDGCDAYLTTTEQEQTPFQGPSDIPQETRLSSSSETLKEEIKKDVIGANTITVSVVGAVQDQISGNTRNEEISKDSDVLTEKIKCVYCGKSFSKNFDLQQHVRSHTGERPFQCVVCGRAFSQKSNVKKHMATHKVWPKRIKTLCIDPSSFVKKTAGEGNAAASVENEGTENHRNIANHLITKSYMCQYCPAVFNDYTKLKSHRNVHIHQKVYRCIQKNCNQTFSDLDSFLGHTQIHENEAQYHCHVCNKVFRSLDDLGTHQYTHSVPTNKLTPRIVTCKKCKNKFANLEALERHMVLDSHTYPCPQCSKVFPCERFLRKHLITHSTDLPYICKFCCKAFKTEQYLNMHIVIHSDEKPFTCQFCPSAFNRRDKLVRHKKIHENIRKFKCPFNKHLGCTKAFNRRDKLKAHMLTHSAKLKYICKTCGLVCQKEINFKRHEKICIQKNTQGISSSSTSTSRSRKKDKIDNNLHSIKDKVEIESDKMSTIEILVVPVNGEQISNESSGTFRVTFPAAKPTPVDLSQTVKTPDQEVPVYKPVPNSHSNS